MANCVWCGAVFEAKDLGRPRLFCCDAHKQAAWKARKGEPVGYADPEVDRVLAEARAITGGSYERPGPSYDSREQVELDRMIGEVTAADLGSGPLRGGPNSKALQHFLQTGEESVWGSKAIVADTTGAILLPTDIQADIATVSRQLGMIRGLASVRPTNNIKQRAGLLSAATVGWGKLETGTSITDAAMAVSSPALDIDVHDVLALAQIGRDELDDSPEAVRAAVTEAIGIAIAEAEDAAFAAGTGTGQPRGLSLAANVARVPAGQKVAAAATATAATWQPSRRSSPRNTGRAPYGSPARTCTPRSWRCCSRRRRWRTAPGPRSGRATTRCTRCPACPRPRPPA